MSNVSRALSVDLVANVSDLAPDETRRLVYAAVATRAQRACFSPFASVVWDVERTVANGWTP